MIVVGTWHAPDITPHPPSGADSSILIQNLDPVAFSDRQASLTGVNKTNDHTSERLALLSEKPRGTADPRLTPVK